MALGPAFLGSQSTEEDRSVPTQQPSRIGRTSRRRQRGVFQKAWVEGAGFRGRKHRDWAQYSLQGQGGLPGRRDKDAGEEGGPDLFFSSDARERDPCGGARA